MRAPTPYPATNGSRKKLTLMTTGTSPGSAFSGKKTVLIGFSLVKGVGPCQAVPLSKNPTAWKLRKNAEEVRGKRYLNTGIRTSVLTSAKEFPFRILILKPRRFAATVWYAKLFWVGSGIVLSTLLRGNSSQFSTPPR